MNATSLQGLRPPQTNCVQTEHLITAENCMPGLQIRKNPDIFVEYGFANVAAITNSARRHLRPIILCCSRITCRNLQKALDRCVLSIRSCNSAFDLGKQAWGPSLVTWYSHGIHWLVWNAEEGIGECSEKGLEWDCKSRVHD